MIKYRKTSNKQFVRWKEGWGQYQQQPFIGWVKLEKPTPRVIPSIPKPSIVKYTIMNSRFIVLLCSLYSVENMIIIISLKKYHKNKFKTRYKT